MDSPSADQVIPGLQNLSVGDIVPGSINGTAHFRVVTLEPNRALMLKLRRHPMTGIWPDLTAEDPGSYLDFHWVFVLREPGDGNTRLLIRNRSVVMAGHRSAPRWAPISLPLADFDNSAQPSRLAHGDTDEDFVMTGGSGSTDMASVQQETGRDDIPFHCPDRMGSRAHGPYEFVRMQDVKSHIKERIHYLAF